MQRRARIPKGRSRLLRDGGALAVVAALLLGTSGATIGASDITYLGKPTNTLSTDSYFPLSGFHRVKTSLTLRRKPEMLLLDTYGAGDRAAAVERWPVVKALQQFGRLTGVKPIDSACSPVLIRSGMARGTTITRCNLATFDLSHAHYSSAFLSFVSKAPIRQVSDTRSVLYQKLTPSEKKVFMRYGAYRGTPTCSRPGRNGSLVSYPCHGFVHVVENSKLPFVLIGDYLQTTSQDLTAADLSQTISLTPQPGSTNPFPSLERPFSFDTIRKALQENRDPTTTTMVEDINGEANIMTALICHADRMRPKSVCTRPAIKSILKSVK